MQNLLVWAKKDWSGYSTNYLVEPSEVMERANLVEGDGFYTIDKLENVTFDEFYQKMGEWLNVDEFHKLAFDDMEDVINEAFKVQNVVVRPLEDYPVFAEDRIVIDKEHGIFPLNRDTFEQAELFEFFDGTNFRKIVKSDDGLIYERKITISDNGISLDEWDEFNMVTGGVGEHQGVYPIYQEDDSNVNKYLLVKTSQQQGALDQADVLSRQELVNHFKDIKRDAKEYLRDIDAVRDMEVLQLLRTDNDFAEEMDGLGLDPDNTTVTFVYGMNEERFNFENKQGNIQCKTNGNEGDIVLGNVKVHELYHESTAQSVLLMDREKLEQELDKMYKKVQKRDTDLER